MKIGIQVLAAYVALWLFSAVAFAGDVYAPRSDWTSFSGGRLNISSFTFRDVNRNGVYDTNDRPMENVAVEMIGPNKAHALRYSNSNGFGNFSMSVQQKTADISQPGDYEFGVLVPDGWIITTDNETQIKSFEVRPGSVADMVAVPPFFPVGLAQVLSITGEVAILDANGGLTPAKDARLTATSPSGDREDVPLGEDGRFRVPAAPGDWTIEATDLASHMTIERMVSIGQAPARLSPMVFGRDGMDAGARPAGLVTVDFESVTQKDIREVPNGIGGLGWWNFVTLKVAPSYTNTAVSGSYVAYNSSGHPARISSAQPFDFVGGFFGVAWLRAEGEILILKGWRGDTLAYEDHVTLSSLGPVWFDADYRSVDRVDLKTMHYWQFVCDDLEFRVPDSSAGQ